MGKKFIMLISILFIVSFCPKINSESCKGAKDNCENAVPEEGYDLCCYWNLAKDASVFSGEFWLKSDEYLKSNDRYYQGCASMTNFQYQTRLAYQSRISREYGLSPNLSIQCKNSSTNKLPPELEPCEKTTGNYSSAPSKDSCGPKTVFGYSGDSMCCYWKPSGKSNVSGFLDKDECAAINDDQDCNLDYYIKKKKKQYGLNSLEIVCPEHK